MKYLCPQKVSYEHFAHPTYLLEEADTSCQELVSALIKQDILFVMEQPTERVIVDIAIDLENKECICVAREPVLGVICGPKVITFCFEDRVLFRDSKFLFAISIGKETSQS